MNNKLKLAVLFGGQSGEHEVSLISAASIIENLDHSKYDIYMIGITKQGKWMLYKGDTEDIRNGSWERNAKHIVFPPDPTIRGFFVIDDPSHIYKTDVVFPVLHGPMGEDGTIQGLLELTGIPFVGCDVLASSTAMDKAVTKAIFKSHDLPQGNYYVFLIDSWIEEQVKIINEIEESFTYPCFIKPVNMGSSVGISKAHSREELISGINEAAKYDRKIIIEEFINCREVECAVLGNYNAKASILGEIIPSKEFYDYEAKYLDGDNSQLLMPAPLSEELTDEIRELALKAYKALDCRGLARVDFFLEKETNNIYLNEVNTIPGFTQISMYPKLWEKTGLPYKELLDTLISLAIEAREKSVKGATI